MTFDLASDLQLQRTRERYRTHRTVDSPQGPNVVVNGRSALAFCSNDYLGLTSHPAVAEAFTEGVRRYGTGGGSSHLVCGHFQVHRQLEEELARFTGRDRVLLFSSGYQANLGVISTLMGKQDALFLDRLNHASLIDAGQLSGARFRRYQHNRPDHLESLLEKSSARRKLVVTDGVFSMDGDLAALDRLAATARQYGAWLMVDDAHGFGWLGENGGGCQEVFQLDQQALPVLVGTFGKAFGTSGAFVAGSHEFIETMIQFCRPYIYTTSMPPAIAEATRKSLQLIQSMQQQRHHLQKIIRRFREDCRVLGLTLMASDSPIQPLVVGSEQNAMLFSQALAERELLVPAIRPPTVPENSARLRFSFSAAHTESQLEQLLDGLESVMRNLPQKDLTEFMQ